MADEDAPVVTMSSLMTSLLAASASGEEDNQPEDDVLAAPLASPPSAHRRSVLRRSIECRNDHLQRLILKRSLRDEAMDSVTVTSREAVSPVSLVPDATRDVAPTDPYVNDLHAEVKQEVDQEMESATIRELKAIAKDCHEYFRHRNEFPLEVRLRNVSWRVWIEESDQRIQTVYNTSALYPLVQAIRRIYTGAPKPPPPERRPRDILARVNLRIQPGKQYLVLGAPGAGKTTLLRAIAGQLHANVKDPSGLCGEISYNGRTLEESNKLHIQNAFAFVEQLDNHAPRLTVKETLEFAYQCTQGGTRRRKEAAATATPEMVQLMERADKEHLATRLTLAALGLTEVQDTFVGNADVRGISGGQRRRVTVGEMLISGAPVLIGDEISTGLDAASTYDMIQVILYRARLRKQSSVISLLQPSPETVSLFDEVIVLSEGQIIYAGSIAHVEDYFAGIGFQSPDFMDVADFLQIVSTNDGSTLYAPEPPRSERPNAPNANELACLFRESTRGIAIANELESPWSFVWTETERGGAPETKACELNTSASVRHQYANDFVRSTELILRRFIVLWLRDKRVIFAGAVKSILMGVSVGGVFASTDDAFSIQGALFQGGLFIMLGAIQASSGLLVDRVVFHKHGKAANFYSAFPFVFGRTLSQMPQTIADTISFASILYYMIGLADRDDAKNFFIYLSIFVTFAILMNAQLAFIASFASGGQLQVYSSCVLLAMMLFGGFIIPPNAIPDYVLWLYWWNPFAWAYRALIVNEFRSGRWADPDQVLLSAGFAREGKSYSQIWIGLSFAYMVPYFLLCCFGSVACLTFIRFMDQGGRAAPSDMIVHDESSNNECRKRLEIGFKPVTLSFTNLCYTVKSSTSDVQLTLLHNVNGVFRPGKMCALMGSSGAGKTTLMDVISLRKNTGVVTGEVRVNGWNQDRAAFRRCSGFVEQFDSAQSPELTVRETVLFSARLRMDPRVADSDEKVQAFVDGVIEDVELTDLANALIGTDETQGLSFEQRKRLSIAVELAASPSIIFLDEPTSGLDARSAQLIVQTLRRIADGMRTVCATIHQPSSAVFSSFDELLLLKKGGYVVYHGELGDNCRTLVKYFESKGAPPISLGENPANWMLRVIATDEQSGLVDAYRHSNEYTSLQLELETLNGAPSESQKIQYDSEFASSGAKMQDLVNRRLRLIYWRSPSYNLARVMVSLLIACVLGSVFIFSRNKSMYSEVDVRGRIAVIFIAFIITGIMAIMSALPVMLKIRDTFYRHRDAGMYNSYSIGLALGVAEKPFIVTSTALFCAVFIASANFGNGVRGLVAFWGFFTFNFAIYSYMGQLFICLVKSSATAIILCSVFVGLQNFFSGFIARPQLLATGFYSIPYYICPGHYVYESLVTSIFHGDDRLVLADLGSEFFDYLAENEENGCTFESNRCIGTVQQYVDVFFGFEYSKDNNLRNAIVLGGVLTLTRVLTLVALKYVRFST